LSGKISPSFPSLSLLTEPSLISLYNFAGMLLWHRTLSALDLCVDLKELIKDYRYISFMLGAEV